jgi:putative FmdB family regulatory protein
MPLYEYECAQCAKVTEVLQRHHDAAPCCPDCQMMMKKQVSRSSFSLKGAGWYKDHYGLKPTPKTDGR